MKFNILKTNNKKFINDFKFFLISAIIFILYSLDRYIPRGWDYYSDNWGVDQNLIENIAFKFATGQSLIGHLSHGIGYPLIISPFLFFASNPLNIAGFFIFTLTATIVLKNIDEVIKSRRLKLFYIFSIIISFVFSPDMKFWVIGASNKLSAVLIILSVLWSISPKVPKRLPVILGLLSGFVFSARYVDYFFLFPLYFSALLNYSKIYKTDLLKNLLFSFLTSLIFIIPTFILHKLVLGKWLTTPYHGKPSDVIRLAGFDRSEASLGARYYDWILPNLYSTLVNYKSFASNLAAKGEPTALLISPILYLTPYSLCNFFFYLFDKSRSSFKKQLKITSLCVFFSITIWTIFYASGWAYTAHDLLFQCLRYFMGWFSLIIFVSLFSLTIKPKINALFFASFIYVIIIAYPSLYLKNEFKNADIIEKIQVYKLGLEDEKKEYNLPIPFDSGRKSLLAISDKNIILGVDNFTNKILLGECNLKNLDTKSFQNNYQNCKFHNSSQQYLAEDGMDFLNLERKNDFYKITYNVFEKDSSIIKNFQIKTKPIKTLESHGSIKLLEDSRDRFIIEEPGNRSFILKRNNKNYLNNPTNSYWPDWKIIAAEKLESKNQILTSNEKNKIYCIWQLNKKWNYNKDKLCNSFNGLNFGKHESQFGVDIDNDGYIDKNFIKQTHLEEINSNQSSKFAFKVNPINFEENKFLIKSKVDANKNKTTKLNIKLIKTGDTVIDTFPYSISLNCGEESNFCNPFKIGRFNNLWRIWIKNAKSYGSLEFVTESSSRDKNPRKKSKFWALQYLTVKSE